MKKIFIAFFIGLSSFLLAQVAFANVFGKSPDGSLRNMVVYSMNKNFYPHQVTVSIRKERVTKKSIIYTTSGDGTVLTGSFNFLSGKKSLSQSARKAIRSGRVFNTKVIYINNKRQKRSENFTCKGRRTFNIQIARCQGYVLLPK